MVVARPDAVPLVLGAQVAGPVDDRGGADTSFLSGTPERAMQTPPAPGAFAAIARLARAFDGAVWQWHQDYATWFSDDDMPEPRAMNIALFPNAEVVDFESRFRDDLWLDHEGDGYRPSPHSQLWQTPGHTEQDASLIVEADDGSLYVIEDGAGGRLLHLTKR